MRGHITRSVRLAAVPLLLAGAAAGIYPVPAAAARAGTGGPAGLLHLQRPSFWGDRDLWR
jgi:hypothetical protein